MTYVTNSDFKRELRVLGEFATIVEKSYSAYMEQYDDPLHITSDVQYDDITGLRHMCRSIDEYAVQIAHKYDHYLYQQYIPRYIVGMDTSMMVCTYINTIAKRVCDIPKKINNWRRE